MNGLEEEWAGSVHVVQVNVRDGANRAFLENLDARFTPTFVLFDAAGQEVWRSVGSIDPAEVRGQVKSLLEP